jgi:hypothetical protein
VVCAGEYAGRLVEVLCAAPPHRFTLPNGVPHSKPDVQPSWVVNILGTPVLVSFSYGEKQLATQGVARDSALRPLRGLDAPHSVEEKLTV